MYEFDVIIIGTGASGIMCAIEAGKRNRRIALIDHQSATGKKILISGGGYCNFTNRVISKEHYISSNPSFVHSALARFTPDSILKIFNDHRIPFHEKKNGQLFCKTKSSAIVNTLKQMADDQQARFFMNHRILSIKKDDRFHIHTSSGDFVSSSLVIATGGLSYQNLGASDLGYRIAKQFGLSVIPPQPGLVPLRWNDQGRKQFGALAGISIPVRMKTGKHIFDESMLFTHHGISGPAVLQASLYWKPKTPLMIDLLPDLDLQAMMTPLRAKHTLFGNLLNTLLPKRFVIQWLNQEFQTIPINQLSRKSISVISDNLHHWTVEPAGYDDYSVAEVTAGGIDTNELSSKTMESKKNPGLYFTGEVVDVTGQLGGYNLHWAWASGYAAGCAV